MIPNTALSPLLGGSRGLSGDYFLWSSYEISCIAMFGFLEKRRVRGIQGCLVSTEKVPCNYFCLLEMRFWTWREISSTSGGDNYLPFPSEVACSAQSIKFHRTNILSLKIDLEDYAFAISQRIPFRADQACLKVSAVNIVVVITPDVYPFTLSKDSSGRGRCQVQRSK